MSETRLQELLTKLERGQRKTSEMMRKLTPGEWNQVVYAEPSPWSPRNLLAHFLSSERELLRLCQDVAGDGPGAPEGFDYNSFNAEEQTHHQYLLPEQLLEQLEAARSQTIGWLRTVEESQLDRIGRHPALGEVSLETMILAIYGHVLMHMRDLQSKLGRGS